MQLTLGSLKASTFTARITYPDGTPLLYDKGQPVEYITLGSLSWIEWEEAAIGVERPKPPTIKRMVNNKPTNMEDKDDPQYRHELSLYNDRIAMNRLALAMAKEGSSFCELMSTLTPKQRVDMLLQSDRAVVQGLFNALATYTLGPRAVVGVEEEARQAAEAFQRVPETTGADFVPLETDA
ncbi:hypothetical protein G4Y79_05235 [Phototrophicus methaneseepsis]|uniref:Tail assembly chaperone n=1 Tax=Phototrophicus methaneseepsis TaxID=2710758 RepID=A0A7S8EBC1_9CHLR|nr:hypothetical protein [Phototrophicus methaneseepsis]QPC83784.1 hypothetical protein G4Y79_05235 [Phototrophicus methaneseepsis]